MKQTLNIKNMVCDRCKSTVLRELEELGCDIKTVELGQIVLNKKTGIQTLELEKVLSKHGFEIIKDETEILIEEIKIALIKKIENQDNANLSSFLTKRFNNYSYTKNWLSNYYSPLEKELATLKKDLSKDEETKEVVQSYKDEIELYKRFKDYFGYGFYVARKVN